MKNIFPVPKKAKFNEGSYTLPKSVGIYADSEIQIAAEILSDYLSLFHNVSTYVAESGDVSIYHDETVDCYEISVNGEGISIKAKDISSAISAVSTLEQIVDGGTIPYADIADAPYAPIRGVHFYLPAREGIEEFKRIINVMSHLKMNTVFLEVGGGMEYERHPEINEAWVKFCDTLNYKFPGPGRYRSLQGSDIYWKDSVHTELAGGSYLTKNEVRDLVSYCKARGMEVIPEIQALSHAYYLTISHPEIAEMKDDPFPDTYCPLDERSYELYFEVAEEVLEVFDPKTVSIGHDEIRVLGWCNKCKDKTGHELVGYEIRRLYNFYKERGIRIAMWGESLQNFVTYTGTQIGVNDIKKKSKFGYDYHLPATDRAIEMVPNDVLILDWYHSLGATSEDGFTERGFEVIYGNYHGSAFGEWETRSKKPCIRGAEVSSWCPPDEFTFARDGIFYDMAYSAALLWNDEEIPHEQMNGAVISEAARMRAIMRRDGGEVNAPRSAEIIYLGDSEKAVSTIDMTSASVNNGRTAEMLKNVGDRICGVPVNTGGIFMRPSTYADKITFVHASTEEMPFKASHLFENRERWALGAYAVMYEDGTVEIAPVYYGIETGALTVDASRRRDYAEKKGVEIDIDISSNKNCSEISPYYSYNHEWYESLAYNTVPVFADGVTAFAYEWRNPYPEKLITKIKPINVCKTMEQTLVLFAVIASRD